MIFEAKENGCNEQGKGNEFGLNFTNHLVLRSLSFYNVDLLFKCLPWWQLTGGIYHFFISLLLYTLDNKSPNICVIPHFSNAN